MFLRQDGDGARVSKTITVSGVTTTTFYIGSHFEITSTGGLTGITKYYYFGAQRVAMRHGSSVTYLHSDHLGSSNVASNGSGALISRQTYFPFGTPRASDTAQMTAVIDFGFTGQKLDASDGLMYYNARYYDAGLGRFISADTIVPSAGNPQSLNRYSYVLNNPLKYTDPGGHCYTDINGVEYCDASSGGGGGGDVGGGGDSGGGGGGDLPKLSATCIGSVCQLAPKLTDAIKYYAEEFGIPYDLPYTVLLTEVMTDMQNGQGAFDLYNQSNAFASKYGLGEMKANGQFGLGLANLIEELLHFGNNPGIGNNNIHSGTVVKTQDWFSKNYPGSNMTNLVNSLGSTVEDTVLSLAGTNGNILAAAAHLKQLADQKTGALAPHSDNLTVVNQAIIYGAYRAGIGPGQHGWTSIHDFQSATTPGPWGATYIQFYMAH